MDNPANLEDVRNAIERPLASDEERVIPDWLGKAWRELNRVIPGMSARTELPEDNPAYLHTDDIKDVVVAMVERKLRNPSGLREWRGDDYGETVDPALASGQIYVTAAERDKLSPVVHDYGTGIFSIPLTVR